MKRRRVRALLAALVIHDTAPAAYGWGVVEGSWSGPQLDLERENGGADRAALEGWLSNEAARGILSGAGLDLDALMETAKTTEFSAVPIEGAKAVRDAEITNSAAAKTPMCMGVLPGTEAPRRICTLYGALGSSWREPNGRG